MRRVPSPVQARPRMFALEPRVNPVNLLAPPTLVGVPQFVVGTDPGGPDLVRYFDPNAAERTPPAQVGDGAAGGSRVAAADFNTDSVPDIVIGTGPGTAARVRVIDGLTKAELFSTDPFEARYTGGVFVAAGDVNRDGVPDLVITPDQGGGPRVRVFSGVRFTQLADFLGIEDPNFRGGARAAVGDVNGDGFGDLVVAAGFGGGPRVAVFNGTTVAPDRTPLKFFGDFLVFEPTLRNGVFVAAGDINGDRFADVIAGGGPGGGPRVLALSGAALVGVTGQVVGPTGPGPVVTIGPTLPTGTVGSQVQLANFFAGDVNSRGGVRVAVKDLDGDARADLVTGAGTGAGTRVVGYLGRNIARDGTPLEQFRFDAFPGFVGGVFVG